MKKEKKEELKKPGVLFICGTPIGNLSDITLRVLQTLKEVDLIAAEDTRHTQKLLNFYGIKKNSTSYFEHNKMEKTTYLINLLKEGKKIALVSDAGMPGISDPGYILVNSAINENIKIIPIPGVSASLTALVVSGLVNHPFIFEGFLSRKKSDRRNYLSVNKAESRTIVLYESPFRIKKTLLDILEIWGDRKIALARELTKKFEEIIRGKISEVLLLIDKKEIKGEITLVIQGNKNINHKKMNEYEDNELLKELLKLLIEKGDSNKKIYEKIKLNTDLSKNKIYKKILEIKKEMDAT